jgi:Fe-S-cluster containining protein
VTHDDVTSDDLFQCRTCGDCCTGYGGTYVTEKDIENISAFINVDKNSFIETYCRMSGGKPLIASGPGGKCVFFDPDKQCTIHPVKPKMCRAWPFIENLLKEPGNWEVMAQACPGIRTGFTPEQITMCVQKELDALRKSRDEDR